MKRWLARVKASLEIGDGRNLLDRHYEPKSKLIVSREVYARIMEHCFLFRQVFRSFCFMVSMYFARNLPLAINWEVKKEGFLCLLRSSQALFAEGVSKLSDSMVLGIKCMSLRLQCEMARNIFNTQFLPVIGSEDPIIVKLIRNAHEMDIETNRRLHNMEKTTRANLVRGQIGMT